jgi:hypothetical protein
MMMRMSLRRMRKTMKGRGDDDAKYIYNSNGKYVGLGRGQ